MQRRSGRRPLAAECAGTFILVLFGTGVVQMTGAQSGLWQAAVVWGVVVALAICSVGVVSGAHTNPAMRTAASEGKSQEPEE